MVFLLQDEHFPRSVRYCLGELEGCLSQLPNHAGPLKLLRIAERRLKACASTSLRRQRGTNTSTRCKPTWRGCMTKSRQPTFICIGNGRVRTGGGRTLDPAIHRSPAPGTLLPPRLEYGKPALSVPWSISLSIHVALNHVTHYRYDRRVALGPQLVRLRPAPHSRTPHSQLLAARAARPTFRQLAAGPAEEFSGAAGVSGTDQRVPHRSRSRGRDVRASIPSTSSWNRTRRGFPLPMTGQVRELAPVSGSQPAGPLRGVSRANLARTDADDRLSGGAQPAACSTNPLRDPHGAGRADAASKRSSWQRLVPRLGMAAGAVLRHLGLAARFVSGYLIQLKADVKPLDGPPGPSTISPICTPGRSLSARRGLGRSRSDFRAAGRRGPHSAGLHAAIRSSAAPVTGAGRAECEVEFASRDVGAAHPRNRRASPSPTPKKQWQAIEALGQQIDADLRRRRRAPDHGRRADLRLDRRHGRRGMEHGRPGPTKRAAPVSCSGVCTNGSLPGLLHFGQGKWYPGEPLPRWALGCYWRSDGVPCGTPRADRRRGSRLRPRSGRRPSLHHGARGTVGRRSPVLARLRGCFLLPLAGAAIAGESRSPRRAISMTPSSGTVSPKSSIAA